MKPVLRVFHNMARSGGTMVCKCLGAMEGVRLFSEIHPQANHVAYLNVTDQAHRWYGLATEQDVKRNDDFVTGVQTIHRAAEVQGHKMVLRDWASIDFVGKILVEEPVYRFRLNEALAPHFDLRCCALVRHPLDQWLSTRRLKIYSGKLDAATFFLGYRRYAEAVADQFIQYEAFSRDPLAVMGQIAGELSLDVDPGFVDRWYRNECITGDNKKSSRGSAGNEAILIRPMPRREVDPALEAELAENSDYLRSLALLGY